MIFFSVFIAFCGVASGDVSDIVNPLRQYLPPRGYLPPAIPKLYEASTPVAAITTPIQGEEQYSTTPLPIIVQDIVIQSNVAPENDETVVPDISENLIEKDLVTASPVTVSPVSNTISVQRQYLPPLTSVNLNKASEVVQDASDLLSLPLTSITSTPKDVEITSSSNPEDMQLLTTTLSQPTLNTITLPQNMITSSTDEPTTDAPRDLVSSITENNPILIASTLPPTSIPDYVQNKAEQSTAENDPLIRINASELSEVAEEISELPSSPIEISTPGTILSEDGYHYSVPVISFGLLNKN